MVNILQGGNNIHAKGASAMAQVLKDNSVITSVTPLPFGKFCWCNLLF